MGWVCVVEWPLVSMRTFSVMYDHTLFYICKLPNQTSYGPFKSSWGVCVGVCVDWHTRFIIWRIIKEEKGARMDLWSRLMFYWSHTYTIDSDTGAAQKVDNLLFGKQSMHALLVFFKLMAICSRGCPELMIKSLSPLSFFPTLLMLCAEAVFLYCCRDCPSCLAHLNSISWTEFDDIYYCHTVT